MREDQARTPGGWRQNPAQTLQRKSLGDEPAVGANPLHKLGDALRDSGKWREADAVFREAVRLAL